MQMGKYIAVFPVLIIVRVVHHFVPQADGVLVILFIGIDHWPHLQEEVVAIVCSRIKAATAALGWFIVLAIGEARIKAKISYQEESTIMPAVISPKVSNWCLRRCCYQ